MSCKAYIHPLNCNKTIGTKPKLIKGALNCFFCRDSIVKNVEQQFKYTEPIRCPNNECQKNLSGNSSTKKV
jgi:hypothetical protein